jgi:hypothetical protein
METSRGKAVRNLYKLQKPSTNAKYASSYINIC